MSQTLYLKPAPGIRVRDPHTGQHLPEAGAELPKNRYWLRRLKDGDVVKANLSKKATTKSDKE